MTEPSNDLSDKIHHWLAPGRDNALLVYGLYLIGLIPIFGVVPILVGLVLAYLNRGQSDPVAEAHYDYQIRQFWIGLLYMAVSLILMVIVIGVIGVIAAVVWWIVRALKGIVALSRGEAPADPKTWIW